MKAARVQLNDRQKEIRALAFAISECDKILLIDSENKGKFSADIDSAILHNACFAIRPHSNIVSLDFDEPGDLELVFAEVIEYIRNLGQHPVIVQSGTPGHLHLFCRVTNDVLIAEIRDFIASRGVSRWMRTNTFIRPPLSFHRDGEKVKLVTPESAQEALALLSKEIAKTDLPEDTIKKIKYGLLNQTKYKSGSELTQAIVNSCYMSGYSFDEIFNILVKKENRGGNSLKRRIRDKGENQARSWLRLSYTKAEKFIASRDLELLETQVSIICKSISRLDINSKRKITLIKTIRAHAEVASRARSYQYNASIRQLATVSAISSIVTITRANRHLITLGYLRRLNKGRETKGSRWELCFSQCSPDDTLCSPHGVLGDTLGSYLRKGNYQGGRGSDVSRGIHFDHDAFRYSYENRRGLGGGAAVVLGCLCSHDGLRIAQICRLTGFSRSAVGRSLEKLRRASLAKRDGFLWGASPGNLDERLDEVAESAGLIGARGRQAEKYRNEREAYQSRYSLR